MSLASPVVFDNGMARSMMPGDVLQSNENIQSITNAAGVTLTAAQILSPILIRSGAVTVSDTTPDANTWLAALTQNTFVAAGATTPAGVQISTTYRIRYMNNNTGTLTIVAGTNVSLAGTTTIATVSFRDYLVTVLNGTPQQVWAVTTTNASAVITGMTAAQTQTISPGQAVSGTGIAGGSTVLSVQPGVGCTLSANATATGTLVAVTFAPRIELRGIGTGAV